jgi:hypothetical protein
VQNFIKTVTTVGATHTSTFLVLGVIKFTDSSCAVQISVTPRQYLILAHQSFKESVIYSTRKTDTASRGDRNFTKEWMFALVNMKLFSV